MTWLSRMDENNKKGNNSDKLSRPDTITNSDDLPDKTVFKASKAEDKAPTIIRDRNKLHNKSDATNVLLNHQPMKRRLASENKTSDVVKDSSRQQGRDATRVSNQKRTPPQSGQSMPIANPEESNRLDEEHNVAQKRVLKDRFTLEKVIGIGGMGVVYKATDRLKVEARDKEPHVAIKVLSEEFKSHPESFIALQRESRKTQRLANPNVVKVYDFDRDGDTVFMTMEYMEGIPLDQLIKNYSNTGLPGDDVWRIVSGLCSALIHAHADNIVHSDFKPGNIFITDAGIPKIFDFGIARAVANIDKNAVSIKDRTVFDAGTLGALTPAYASLEMLKGMKPDVRDDVYALGCITYEMLTGRHPFNRIPADEAFASRLKPKKIPDIKKHQWRAIEKALAFKREDRTNSVEEFHAAIQRKSKHLLVIIPTVLVIMAIAIATYFIISHEPNQQNQTAIQVNQLKYKIRYNLFKEKISKLVKGHSFSRDWERALWDEVSGMTELLNKTPDKWLQSVRHKIYTYYINEYNKDLTKPDYNRALELLKNAYRYSDDHKYLDSQRDYMSILIQKLKSKNQKIKNELIRNKKVLNDRKRRESQNGYLFGLALKNVNQQLECQSKLNMRELSVAIKKLRSINRHRYSSLEKGMIGTLAECIRHTAKTQPERAMVDKNYALRIFSNNHILSDITILPRDACNKSIAGLGSRGDRTVCRDKLSIGGDGPAMVVVPGNNRLKSFAIGKYEISTREINDFCKKTLSCSPRRVQDDEVPAVNIDFSVAKKYIKWLSKISKQKYRLPTLEEWTYAANAVNHFKDPNRNCALNTRGIEKGGELLRVNTGVQNDWGLVNYFGNAQEWVYDENRNLVAVGGSFIDSMDKCNADSIVPHSGKADNVTGFRVVRDVVR